MPTDRDKWESRHADPSHPQLAPSLFLREWAHALHGRVLDLAAGSGRNTLFLARRGHRVDAIDIAASGLRNIQAAAHREGLDVGFIQTDLTSFPLPAAAYDVILNIRYLQRSLFEPIRHCLRPGGIVLFETFLIDQQSVGHPMNPEFLLARGELDEAFSSFDILFSSEGRVDTEGNPAFLARLVARRPLL